MRIIFSPTKTMQQEINAPEYKELPVFLPETETLLKRLRELSEQELKKLWKCSDEILEENIQRLRDMKLEENLSSAISSFEGLAFKYLDYKSLKNEALDYLQEKLRILSGFYGALKPFDGITPYRLDMEHRLTMPGYKNLYDFWGDKIYRELRDESRVIINLASGEYAKCVEKYISPEDCFISCSFVEKVKGELKQKATFSKMARGEMLRFMAENSITDPEELKGFTALNFEFRPELSNEREFVFLHLT